MDVINDLQRTINWLDRDRSPKWSLELVYEVTTQKLVEATRSFRICRSKQLERQI
ncbi:hypothetical protein [Parachlamydia acanthamoebae]|jgi:hypothetical protein|uniref:hypothetical protein n=2 Tax=Parachlamydiaceae TaxID=92713 RepID=UPI0001C17871|nr:hypothetical protein [Parachlamydia acanthamoebae]EFB42274.1 hypothetical protein pah_c013o041 [Parachlamydia acanthamoebae str. Hall's coccus]